jgi:uncharacterized membrane protein YeaQ/YmgE (transglycosylase-associated protein family)
MQRKSCFFAFFLTTFVSKHQTFRNFVPLLIITTMGIIGSIIIGCLAGFCAGKLMKGGGFGFIMNLVLGLFGGVLGGWLFQQLGIQWGGLLGQLGTAIIGAVAILWIASLIKK